MGKLYQELEKIDIIRERIEVDYKEAKEALDLAKGDILRHNYNRRKKEEGYLDRTDTCGRIRSGG